MPAERPTGWDGEQVAQPKVDDVRAAAERIRGHVVRTPLVSMADSGCLLKPQTLQSIGSFNIRGALNWAAQLTAMADPSRPDHRVCILSGASIGIDEYTELLRV